MHIDDVARISPALGNRLRAVLAIDYEDRLKSLEEAEGTEFARWALTTDPAAVGGRDRKAANRTDPSTSSMLQLGKTQHASLPKLPCNCAAL